jgi:hypothetical protein
MAMAKCLRVLLPAIDHPRPLIIDWEMDHHHLVTTRQGLHPLLRTIRERDCPEIL